MWCAGPYPAPRPHPAGSVHSSGYGHLMRLNGREGGSKTASGRQLMSLWDAICQQLRVVAVSTEDVSNKVGGWWQ